MTDALGAITKDMFAGSLNGTFCLPFDDGTAINLVLDSLSDLRTGLQYEAFSLVFLGPRDPILPQQLYHMQNELLGALTLFLVPIGQDAEHTRYEAVINRKVVQA